MAKMKKAPRAKQAAPGPSRAQQVLRETWASASQALSTAEAEVEKQVKRLLRKNKLNVDDASEMLRGLRARLDKQRKKGMREVEARLEELQARVKKESRSVAQSADEAVQRTLAALNIPSRREVGELTRKIEELSKKIDGLRRKRK